MVIAIECGQDQMLLCRITRLQTVGLSAEAKETDHVAAQAGDAVFRDARTIF
jgi:hypothetical protein